MRLRHLWITFFIAVAIPGGYIVYHIFWGRLS